MILNLLVLFAVGVTWIASLWLLIAPDFSHWTRSGLFVSHLLPPLSIWLIWLVLRKRTQEKRTDEARAREEAAQAERKAAREAARKKYEEEMRQRRYGCDCRMVAVSRLGLASALSAAEIEHPGVDIRPAVLDSQDESDGGTVLDRLQPAIVDAMVAIYSTCRASAAFPIFVLPPSDISGEEVLVQIRAIHDELAGELVPEMKRDDARPPILFLPASDCVPNSIVSLFEAATDLPGAVILAFDSPFARARMDDDDFEEEQDRARLAREQFAGKPSEAVVALLLTNAELPSMLDSIAGAIHGSEHDSMTPYWEKAMQAGGRLEILARATHELRSELSELPILARVHRAVVQTSTSRSGVLELTRLLQDVLEQAQINAGLIDLPFELDGAAADNKDAGRNSEKTRCGTIVHNAGNVDVAGKRLAALGSALYYFNIDLSPVDPDVAVNIVSRIGDMGCAAGLGQLALGLAGAAQRAAPALYAEFLDGESVAASFFVPVHAAPQSVSTA